MHPTYVSDEPGNCPICGMKLVPIPRESTSQTAQQPTDQTSSVTGYGTVNLTAERQQLMGIKLARAEKLPLEQTIRTFGRVTYDETRLNHIHTKFEGYIEK